MFRSTSARRGLTSALSVATIAAVMAGPLAGVASAAAKGKTPKPTITSGPDSVTSSRSATFAFTDSAANVKFTCSLDNAAFTACTSPKSYSGLAAGNHNFRVNAKLPKRPRSANASYNWTIDVTAPPAVTFNGVPTAGSWVSASPDITIVPHGDATTFTCSIDGGDPVDCTTNDTGTTAVTEDGIHTLTVVPSDAAGNAGPAATATWQLDAVDPDVNIVGPGTATNDTTPTFTIVATDNHGVASVQCTLDANAPVDCSSGTFTPGSALSAGNHTLSVQVTDIAGRVTNGSYTPIPDQPGGFKVDTAFPTVTFDSQPAAFTKDTTPSFAFTAADADNNVTALECVVDPVGASSGWTWGDCSTGVASQSRPGVLNPTISGDGTHTIYIRATDAAANVSVLPFQFVLDTVKPVVSVTGLPTGFTNKTTAVPAISVSDANATMPTCTLNGNDVADCLTLGTLSDGLQTFVVTETDLAGNTTVVTKKWVVDTVRPTVTSFGKPTTLTNAAVVRFGEPVKSRALSGLALRVNSSGKAVSVRRSCLSVTGATVACSTSTFRRVRLTPVAPLTPGQRYVITAARGAVKDLAGNLSVSAKSSSFRAQRVLDESSPAAKYAWQKVGASGAYAGSYVREHRSGATAAYRFRGTSVKWWTVTGPSQGKARVYVDGKRIKTVNNYATSTHYRVARTFRSLGTGRHTLSIRVLGVKGAKAGTGTNVAVDAITSSGTLVKTPSLAAQWGRVANRHFVGGKARIADLRGESVSLTFRGTGLTWVTSTGRKQGTARVYVDGTLVKTFKNAASATTYGVRRVIKGLTDKVHTVRIVVAGTGGAHQVTIDGFRVA